MYRNLNAEMARRNVSIVDLAQTINCSYETMRKKLKGESPLLFKEALAIKKVHFPNLSLEKLYETEA
mgnify:CR=1 FL=1